LTKNLQYGITSNLLNEATGRSGDIFVFLPRWLRHWCPVNGGVEWGGVGAGPGMNDPNTSDLAILLFRKRVKYFVCEHSPCKGRLPSISSRIIVS